MRIHANPHAAPIEGEAKLLERIQALHKRNDTPTLYTAALKNSDGQLRLRIECHVQAEESNLVALLDRSNFVDELDDVGAEDELERGDELADFDGIFSPR
ncbi:hypothetical protein [Xylophilus ampelinus]|uniref:Uncharacterized protein n=1 Tax=Xylophilus ampelinus TaxID=54067 RepID=A0A318SL06_9BURK|nr:hypothetical protein [Xylophilus ampelinus]MCS4509290.1 hypothetical protein [Xylophilus ampelinus]PYE79685.1 hypothetical protein DFQ15_1014 [Xylophilus ampelinus]